VHPNDPGRAAKIGQDRAAAMTGACIDRVEQPVSTEIDKPFAMAPHRAERSVGWIPGDSDMSSLGQGFQSGIIGRTQRHEAADPCNWS
jgi:hypothetical protein